MRTKRTLPKFNSDKDYINYVNGRLDSLETFKASGKLKISNSHKSDSATSAIMIKRPDSIRMESFSVFGQAVFFFASKNTDFSIFVPKENKFFTGTNTLENIQKVLPLDVSVGEFAQYLVGNFKREESDSVEIKYLEEKKIYKIYYHGENKRVLWLNPKTLEISKCTIYDEDDMLKAIVSYSDFREVDNIMFPMNITIKFPDLEARIEVRYDEIQINEKCKDDIFTLDVPEKALIIDLDSKAL